MAAGSLGSDLPAYDQFTVGGFFSLSGLERGQRRGERSGDIGEDLIYAGTVLFGVDSFLGPLYIAYGVADIGQDELYVSLGRAF